MADRRDFRLPHLGRSLQERDVSERFPMILTSGRLVEYEGGGEETRSNRWLAELQQTMFAEIFLRRAEDVHSSMELLQHPFSKLASHISELSILATVGEGLVPWFHLLPRLLAKLPLRSEIKI